MLIFEKSKPERQATAQFLPVTDAYVSDIPTNFLRQKSLKLPSCSELDVVRHYTCLSKKNFSIDTNFYPLGSCTMKYNPRGVHQAASIAGFLERHPLTQEENSQGYLEILYKLQNYLCDITGMAGISLTPMAGSQGEFAGVAMIKAYHQSRGEGHRDEMLIPDAAHGTNPASAVMGGFKVIELKTAADGDLDLNELKSKLNKKTAGIMLTNPSTCGLFMRQIKEISDMVHEVGGLLYYDGANLNAILGQVRPGDMGFDVMHLNLHKTFATPHGAGGPGSGPVAAAKHLTPFLPLPLVKKTDIYRFATLEDHPNSIGRLSCFMGNAGILLRAYFYISLLGKNGLKLVSQYAALNANYLLKQLTAEGFQPSYPNRLATHEFILTFIKAKKEHNISAMDIAKRLLDFNIHAPTTYFPLLIPECMLIEPTETESKEVLDNFIKVMKNILKETKEDPNILKTAPHTLPVKRLDDVKAARDLDLNYFRS